MKQWEQNETQRNKRSTIKNSNDQQNTSSSSYKVRSRNTFNKITSTKI